jgi:photosystem II PsbZ protein
LNGRCVAYRQFIAVLGEEEMFTILFQFALAALVILSFAMVVGVPVAYASPQNWDQSKRLLFVGSAAWAGLVILVGVLNYLVV